MTANQDRIEIMCIGCKQQNECSVVGGGVPTTDKLVKMGM